MDAGLVRTNSENDQRRDLTVLLYEAGLALLIWISPANTNSGDGAESEQFVCKVDTVPFKRGAQETSFLSIA